MRSSSFGWATRSETVLLSLAAQIEATQPFPAWTHASIGPCPNPSHPPHDPHEAKSAESGPPRTAR